MLAKLLIILTLAIPLTGQGIVQILGQRPPSGGGADVTLDTANTAQHAPGTSLTHAITLTAGTNRVISLFVGVIDSGSVAATGVTGAGASWSQIGTAHTGNSTIRGYCFVGIAPTATGSTNLTVTLSGTPSLGAQTTAYHWYDANQTTPTTVCTGVNSGNLSVTVPSGGRAVSIQYDSVDQRTVSGCTTTRDHNAYTFGFGYSAANCTSGATFTWSGFGTISMALGMDIAKQ